MKSYHQTMQNRTIFIFDDVVSTTLCEIISVSVVTIIWIASIYVYLTYTKIPKQLIRDNANFIVLFEQGT